LPDFSIGFDGSNSAEANVKTGKVLRGESITTTTPSSQSSGVEKAEILCGG
jgi:hypothetical protein